MSSLKDCVRTLLRKNKRALNELICDYLELVFIGF